MAWEWIGPTVAGVVGLAGVGSGYFTVRSDHAARRRDDTRAYRSALYVELLTTVDRLFYQAPTDPSPVVHLRPPPTDLGHPLAANVAVFASPGVRSALSELEGAMFEWSAITLAWWVVLRRRAGDEPETFVRGDLRDLDGETLVTRLNAARQDVEQRRETLVQRIRAGLATESE